MRERSSHHGVSYSRDVFGQWWMPSKLGIGATARKHSITFDVKEAVLRTPSLVKQLESGFRSGVGHTPEGMAGLLHLLYSYKVGNPYSVMMNTSGNLLYYVHTAAYKAKAEKVNAHLLALVQLRDHGIMWKRSDALTSAYVLPMRSWEYRMAEATLTRPIMRSALELHMPWEKEAGEEMQKVFDRRHPLVAHIEMKGHGDKLAGDFIVEEIQ